MLNEKGLKFVLFIQNFVKRNIDNLFEPKYIDHIFRLIVKNIFKLFKQTALIRIIIQK